MSEHRFGGRFEAWEPLGQGAEGRLYRVRDRWTGRLCALKVANDPTGAQALAHEFRLLSRYRHPALIESLDLVHDGPDTAHLLEYVPAVDPRTLREVGKEPAVLAAVIQSIRGLEYLHAHGIVHGDVSPGNILVWKDGAHWRAKVADLGLALPVDQARTAGVRGTSGYMAPEVARGDGATAASDWYALALTAVAWIDGEGPWGTLSSTQALRRVAEGTAAPMPRRHVSMDLAKILERLGKADPTERGGWNWEQLREHADAWGPPALAAGVFGLEESLERWAAWIQEIQPGRAGGLLLRGRVGSGRRTAGEALIRSLVSQGWTALWSLPLGALRDWLEQGEGDPDPVRLARELVRRFEGKNVALLWPERSGELESRLLRAFLTSREEEGSELRTVAVKVAPLQREDADASWLVSSLRSLEEEWGGPSAVGLESIRGDLFPAVEGFKAEEVSSDAGSSVLSLVLLKRARASGSEVSAVGSGEEVVEEDVRAAWESASLPARQALAVISRSDNGWALVSLGRCLLWDTATVSTVGEELAKLHLTRREFTETWPVEHMADWLVRERVVDRSEEVFTQDMANGLAKALEAHSELHPGDLSVLRALTERGTFPRAYAEKTLENALHKGRYDAVLTCWHALEATGSVHVETDRFVWEAALRAAHRVGRFPDEVRALQALVPVTREIMEVADLRKMLCEALFARGDWEAAIGACELLVVMKGARKRDRVWAELKKAEYLWQSGQLEAGQRQYDEVGEKVADDRELASRLLVGRARLALEAERPSDAAEYLDTALAKLGNQTCAVDVLYLHTRIGVLIRTGEQRRAESIVQQPVELAERQGAWSEYVLAAARASNVFLELGAPGEAHRLMSNVLAVATAFGAERQIAMARISLGFIEVVLGQLGSALRRVQGQTESTPALRIYAGRLGAFLGARAGFNELLDDSLRQLRETEDPFLISLADQYDGMAHLGREEYEQAVNLLESVVAKQREFHHWDSAAMAECLLAYCQAKCGRLAEATRNYEEARELFAADRYPLFLPVCRIVGMELGYRDTPEQVLKSLEDQNRRSDLILWGSQLLRALGRKRSVGQGVILRAIREATESIDSPALRKQFLSVPAHQRTLRELQA